MLKLTQELEDKKKEAEEDLDYVPDDIQTCK